eukprot:529358-Amphidinium_carterae.2
MLASPLDSPSGLCKYFRLCIGSQCIGGLSNSGPEHSFQPPSMPSSLYLCTRRSPHRKAAHKSLVLDRTSAFSRGSKASHDLQNSRCAES